MEIVLKRVFSTAEIQSINRCRGMLQCIFLSDLITAVGRYLESFVFDPGPFKRRSNYRFPRECPSQKDWQTWFNFWHSNTLTGDKLEVPLSDWINLTHRKWLWYTSPTDELHRIEDGVIYHYLPSQAIRRTRSILLYTLTWKEKIHEDHVMGHPVSVQGVDDMHVNKMNSGPALARGPQQPSNFWEFLRSLGGKWMWNRVKDSQAMKHDLSWLIQGMETNSLIWVTDGSYDRKRAPVISGVGWIIFCQTTGKHLVGLFWKKSPSASLHRAELLGLCLLHLVALALSNYKVSGWKATLGCNNLRALILSSKECRRSKPSAACLDIHWSFRSTKKNFTGCFKYQHVAGHMDKYLLWHQLSLIQQLNCVFNTTAKGAVHKAITTGYTSTLTQILP